MQVKERGEWGRSAPSPTVPLWNSGHLTPRRAGVGEVDLATGRWQGADLMATPFRIR